MNCLRVGVLLVLSLCAQDSTLRFEVASVKHVPPPPDPTGRGVPPERTGSPGTQAPTRLAYRNEWLLTLISTAFEVAAPDITGPAWLSSERYDIDAVVPVGATKEQVNAMLQNLLVERFHLKFRRAAKTHAVYLLRVGKNGPKLKLAMEDAPSEPLDDKYPKPPATYRGVLARPNNDGGVYLTGRFASMAQLARFLGGVRGQGVQILDETGLTGLYDFHLVYADDVPAKTPAPEPIPTVADAVQSLGLLIEKTERPFPALIVESIDREPTAN